jgi:Cdc6-like AAA superfamily ATPase
VQYASIDVIRQEKFSVNSSLVSSAQAKIALDIIRPKVEQRINDAIRSNNNIVMYGPPGQGKTYLVSNLKTERRIINIDCSRSIDQKEIYRIILSNVGYTVNVEQKRKKSASAKLSFKIFGAGADGGVDGSTETLTRELTADLSNATEVAYLLKQYNSRFFIILNRFHLLKRDTREIIISDLSTFSEHSDVRFIIIGNWIDEFYLERHCSYTSLSISKIKIDYWSNEDIIEYLSRRLKTIGVKLDTQVLSSIAELMNGDIRLSSIVVTNFFGEEWRDNVANANKSANDLMEELSDWLADMFEDFTMVSTIKWASDKDAIVSYMSERASTVKKRVYNGKDPETGKRRYSYQEQIVTENEIFSVGIGDYIISLTAQEFLDGVRVWQITDLTDRILKNVIPNAAMVDRKKLTKRIENWIKIQADYEIYPPIYLFTSKRKSIVICNRNFQLFIEKSRVAHLVDQISDSIDLDRGYVSRKRNISIESP